MDATNERATGSSRHCYEAIVASGTALRLRATVGPTLGVCSISHTRLEAATCEPLAFYNAKWSAAERIEW
jgi:hypothetical protein